MQVDRRTVLGTIVGAAFAGPALAKSAAAPSWYSKAIVIDGLGGINDPYGAEDDLRLSDRAWAEMRKTGLTAFRDTIVPVGNQVDAWEQFQKILAGYHDYFRANPERLRLVEKAADIAACKRDGRLGVILGTQDTAMVGAALDRIGEMKKGGIRAVQLTYNLANLSGDGSIEPRNSGLTNLGRDTIRRIESEKLLLDLAHGGARTIEEATAFASRPLTISHSGARALYDHPRNVSDSAIKAVADKGGVVGVYFMPYLAANMHPAGATLLDHIDHVANVAGEDHVSIGTDGGVLPLVIDARAREDARRDYEQRKAAGIAAPGEGPDVFTVVEDYNSIDKLERLSVDLMKRGWSTARLEKLLGANLMRLYAEVWGG
ncbi:MAG TPA: membrane dipeptidase [Sphingomicrobium sp.]|jgi:membrane dipeptidase|nr:membrane dipeptidase [Sphingomicrobium sp.]